MAPLTLAATAFFALPAVSAVAVPDVEISPGVKMPMIAFLALSLQWRSMIGFAILTCAFPGHWTTAVSSCNLLYLAFPDFWHLRPLALTGIPWLLAPSWREWTSGYNSVADTSTQLMTMVLSLMSEKLSRNPMQTTLCLWHDPFSLSRNVFDVFWHATSSASGVHRCILSLVCKGHSFSIHCKLFLA